MPIQGCLWKLIIYKLDKMWILEGRILYQFFSKPMANNVVVQQRSALSETVKVATLVEETQRRLRHTSRELPSSARLETLEELSQLMTNSGHSVNFMKRILETGISKYENRVANSKLDKNDINYRPLHQPSGRSIKKLREKALAKENWYRKDGNQELDSLKKVNGKGLGRGDKREKQRPSTVMMVPSTKGGILIKKLKEDEEKMVEISGFRTKYNELGGRKMGTLFPTNLSANLPCGRETCHPCSFLGDGKKKSNCKQRSVLYISKCLLCNPAKEGKNKDKETGREGIYLGETSRSLAERSQEHIKGGRL